MWLTFPETYLHAQALGHAPAGVVKDRAQEWVPLCLSYLSAQQPTAHPDIPEPQEDDAATHAADPEHPDGPSLANGDISIIAEAAHEAEEGGPGLKIGARCAIRCDDLCSKSRQLGVLMLP